MSVTIRRGQSEEAKHELAWYIMAYEVAPMAETDDTITYYVFDPTNAAMFTDMELNTVTVISEIEL